MWSTAALHSKHTSTDAKFASGYLRVFCLNVNLPWQRTTKHIDDANVAIFVKSDVWQTNHVVIWSVDSSYNVKKRSTAKKNMFLLFFRFSFFFVIFLWMKLSKIHYRTYSCPFELKFSLTKYKVRIIFDILWTSIPMTAIVTKKVQRSCVTITHVTPKCEVF